MNILMLAVHLDAYPNPIVKIRQAIVGHVRWHAVSVNVNQLVGIRGNEIVWP